MLADAGGWQVMKQARSLHQAGRVLEAAYAPPLLQGRVREGQTEFRCGLRIESKSRVENLCTCRASRQHGAICEHSLAVGLEVLRPQVKVEAAPAPAPKPEAVKLAGFAVDGAGTALVLEMVLAPNLVPAWDRNAVQVVFEVVVGGKRTLLGALDRKVAYRCAAEDLRVLEVVSAMTGGELPGMAMMNREQFAGLLVSLAGHPRVMLGRQRRLEIASEALRPPLTVERLSDGRLRLKAEMPGDGSLWEAGPGVWLLRGEKLESVAPGLPVAYRDLLRREVVLPADGVEGFLSRELPSLGAFFTLGAEWTGRGGVSGVMVGVRAGVSAGAQSGAATGAGQRVPASFVLKLEGSLNFLSATLEARRGERRTSLGGAGYRAGDPEEAEALGRLRAAGFNGPDGRGEFALKGETAVLSFFARDLPRFQREWTVTIGERFEQVTGGVERLEPRMEVRGTGADWFDLHLELRGGHGERISPGEIQRLLQSGRNAVKRPNGKWAVFDAEMLEEFQQVLKDCNPRQGQPGEYRIDARHASYLQGVAGQHAVEVQGPAEWRERAEAPRHPDRMEAVALGDLDGVLRPYQKQGVFWMSFLARNRWGGVLADEMGLGKTLQALALIRHLGGRALVVCPTSLLVNWQREAGRFAPELRVLVLSGGRRQELFAEMGSADLVLTSYPLLRRDADRYRGVEFRVMILDEAQHIKNPESLNAQSAQSVRAEHRFVLTGTPVENSVRDLWSIMHFLMPGFLGTRADFKERFEVPIQAKPGGGEQRRLVERVRPFILRRKKAEVAKEIPEKLEQVAYCEMSAEQAEVYGALLSATRVKVGELVGGAAQGQARMVMLTALLRLRQACCDLRLLGDAMEGGPEGSAKLELLEELLQQAMDGGHRVLVFSQFVAMLQLMRERLEALGVDYCYLDGSTKDRQQVVDRFQTGQVPVFLISLKAGGVGLNLTAADTVIHFDPWWNPAVEAQATDRAHRIGQQKVVTVYKLIVRNTVEEKILTLQARKRELVEATLESEQPLMEGLSSEEILGLLD